MGRHFTEEENRAYYATQPHKLTGVMVAYRNSDGHILVVKPGYKPGWNLVGGIIDENESPLAAAVRETVEEIGLTIAPERLHCVGIQYLPPNTYTDFIRIMFTCDLTATEAAAIKIAADELEDAKFVSLDELATYAERPVTQGMHALLTSPTGFGYVEDRVLKGGLS